MGASRGGLCFFYSGEEQRGGYRLVRREEWRGGVAQLKEDMAVVGLANEEADYRNYDYEQWGEWLDALTQQWEEGSAEGSLAEFRKQLLSFSIYPLCYFPVRLPHSLFTERLRRSNLHSGLYCYTLFEAKNRSVWKKLTSKEAEDYRLKQVGNFLEHLQEKGAIIAYRRVLL